MPLRVCMKHLREEGPAGDLRRLDRAYSSNLPRLYIDASFCLLHGNDVQEKKEDIPSVIVLIS